MEQESRDIAIIGLACRFPGARNVEAYWENLTAGRESITFFSEEELLAAGVDSRLLANPNYVRAAPIIADMDKFDAAFFDYSPREARMMDPQQRLLLETAWKTFEDAGYDANVLDMPVAVFAGSGGVVSSYLVDQIKSGSDLFGATGSLEHMGNDKDFIATRISYKLNLTGPSLTVQTACSTSMVAVHLACQSLLNGESDMALAGAATVRCPHIEGYLAREGDILSSDGHCRAFDAKADGTIFGSGVGAVLLKPLERAVADNDHIYAVIKATAINNDGRNKVSYTASSVDGQAKVMVEALTLAGVAPDQIGMVECHGTGTIVGDPLEIQALSLAYKHLGAQNQAYCAVGSVKTNIGHLEQASGIAALIKAALCVERGKLVPSINFKKANRKIRFRRSPFYVNTKLEEWAGEEGLPRIACVNSLGLGGSNAFAVLEQAPPRPTRSVEDLRDRHILTISAKSQAALRQRARQYLPVLEKPTAPALADICHTLNAGRSDFGYRFATVVESRVGAAQALTRFIEDAQAQEQSPISTDLPIIFLFPGQGSQYVGMARKLYAIHPVFRETIDECADLLADELDVPLRDLLLSPTSSANAERIHQTAYAQPALYAVGVALDRLWRSWGIVPTAVMGHSVGEYAAATSANVMTLEEGIKLIAARGRLMQSLPAGGAMASILAEQATVEAILADLGSDDFALDVVIAGINAPNAIVVSGTAEAVDAVVARCTRDGIISKSLNVSHAFHSRLLDPILDEFEAVAAQIDYQRPRVGLLSNLTGQIIYQAPDAAYWRNHARQPVRFAACVGAAQEFGARAYLELGPGNTLLKMARANKPAGESLLWLPSIERESDAWQTLLDSLASLYRAGATVDWEGFDRPFLRARLSLPTYPFQGQRFWYESTTRTRKQFTASGAKQHPFLGTADETVSGERVYRKSYNLNRFGFLDHHRIYGLPVLPFAVGLEALLAAGAEYFGELATINHITYQTALMVEDRAVEMKLVAQSPDSLAFELASRPEKSQGILQTHMVGSMSRGLSTKIAADPLLPKMLTADGQEDNQEMDTELFYARVDRVGLNYGPLFRGTIKALWQMEGEVITNVCLHDDLNPAAYAIHPALLDGCLHLFPALAAEYGDFTDLNLFAGPGYLPISIETFSLNGPVEGSLWVRARRREEAANGDGMILDIDIYDEQGTPVGVMSGFEVRKISKAALRPVDYLPHAYALEWFELPAVGVAEAEDRTREAQGWIIVGDSGGVADALSEELRALGDQVCIMTPASFESSSASGWQTALDQATAALQIPCNRVLFLAGLDAGEFDDLTVETVPLYEQTITRHALLLTQALAARDGISATIWLVTRNAVDAGIPSLSPTNPVQTALWGFGRSLAQEMQPLWGGLIDLPKTASPVPQLDARALLAELTHRSVEDQVAVRAEGRYGPRLVRVPVAAKQEEPLIVRPEASYLISGGLGGLGLQVARWLVDQHSATHLVLMSRSATRASAAEQIDELERAGCTVTIVQGDVCCQTDVARIFEQINRQLPPLRGIVHCAGGLDDGIIANMDWQKFTGVTRPKTVGAWLLHRYSAEQPLDFFLLFSSVLSIMGSAGQCNYAAGNAFLDGLGAARRALGLPATVINWGPWSDVGMAIVSADRGEQIWKRRGVQYIPPALGIEYLDTLMNQGLSQAAVMIADWDRYTKQFEKIPPMYAKLVRRSPLANPSGVAQKVGSLHDMPIEKRREALTTLIRGEVAAVLGVQPDEIGIDQALDEWGLDSLMTVELINRFHSALPVNIPKTTLVQKPNVGALVDAALLEFDDVDSEQQVTKNEEVAEGSWLVIRRPRSEAKLKLLCFGFAGGGPGIYNEWADGLPESIEVAAIHLPGRGTRLGEKAPTRISETVDQLVQAILPYLDRPFALFGHCIGAILMYETAKRLSSQYNLQAVHLFASGAAAPDLYTIPAHYEASDAKLLNLLKLVDFAATEGLVQDAELRALAFPTLRADLEAAAFYTIELNGDASTLPTPITAFGGWEDMYAAPHGVDGWRRFTSKSFDIMMRPGNHYFLETEREVILDVVGQILERHLTKQANGSITNVCHRDVDSLWLQSDAATRTPAIGVASNGAEKNEANWIRRITQDKEGLLPVLVCFPPAWVDGLHAENWAPTLSDGLETLEIIYPGHGELRDQAPVSSIAMLAQSIEAQLASWSERPLIFFGHCMGAIVAYEVARSLHRQSKTNLVHLFVSGATSPDTFVYPWVHLQPDDKIRELMQTIDYPHLELLSPNHGDEASKSHFAMLRADFKAQATYRYTAGEPLDIPITAFTGRKDYWTSPMGVRLWANQTRARFHEIPQSGGHFDLPKWMPLSIKIIKDLLKQEEFHVT